MKTAWAQKGCQGVLSTRSTAVLARPPACCFARRASSTPSSSSHPDISPFHYDKPSPPPALHPLIANHSQTATPSSSDPVADARSSPPTESTTVRGPRGPPPAWSDPRSPNLTAPSARDLLREFVHSLSLETTPRPTPPDLEVLLGLYTACYPPPPPWSTARVSPIRPVQIELLLHMLAYAVRLESTSFAPGDKKRFQTFLDQTILPLADLPYVDLSEYDLSPKTYFGLISRCLTYAQLSGLMRILSQASSAPGQERPGDLDLPRTEVEAAQVRLKDLADRRKTTHADPYKPKRVCQDWIRGYTAGLGDILEGDLSFRRADARRSVAKTEADWISTVEKHLKTRGGTLDGAFLGLERLPLGPIKEMRTVELAEKMYKVYCGIAVDYSGTMYGLARFKAQYNQKEHGEVLVRMLSLFARTQLSSFNAHNSLATLLAPILPHLDRLPDHFIPATPTYPNLAVNLLPLTTDLEAALTLIRACPALTEETGPAVRQAFTAALEGQGMERAWIEILIERETALQVGAAARKEEGGVEGGLDYGFGRDPSENGT